MVNELQAVGNQAETIRIGGVRFQKDEVQGIDKKTVKYKDGFSLDIFTVQTTFGRFEYPDSPVTAKGASPSIMNNKLKDVDVLTYRGTKDQDVLYLENSYIGSIFTKNDGKKDIFYLDQKSNHGPDEWHEMDSKDEVWHRCK